MTRHTAPLQNRFDISAIFDVLDPILVSHAALVLLIPSFARFIALFRRQQRRAPACQIENPVILLRGCGLFEWRRLLTMRMTPAAVSAPLARPNLMPRL